MEWVDVKLQSELADAARMLARERDVTVSQLLRELVKREIDMTRRINSIRSAEERSVEGLKSRLMPDFMASRTWPDLKTRLKNRGYCLVASSGGLALHDRETGKRICKSSEIGFGYSKLIRKMGAPFPGHPHAWLDDRVLPMQQMTDIQKEKPPATDVTDDFDVIEPF